MKDLGQAKRILGMRISRDRRNGKIWLSQERYIERVLERFNVSKAKAVSTLLGGHFILSSKHCPTSEEEKEAMKNVPYASAVGSLMSKHIDVRYHWIRDVLEEHIFCRDEAGLVLPPI
ncbi:unnamed protein product [Linum trigynum]|uniref:Reverse transcriptase Ty1/copia-type domain-containing protein n=1 Tax=Linum trigynum TaxID=586398 RepID=A0AAV2GW25_9ROSI